MSNSKLYVGNLSFDATEADIRAIFSEHGAVTDIHLPIDRDSGRPRGFAFVTMDTAEAAKSAENELNGKNWMGRNLAVNEARPQTDRPAFSGGGGGGGGRGGYGGGGGGGGRGGYGGGGGDRGDRGGYGGGGGGGRGGYGDKRGGGGGGRY